MPAPKTENPFRDMSTAELSKVVGQMIRKEYDFTGKDINIHPLDLTEVLMERLDKVSPRDTLMRDTFRSWIGRVQEAVGLQPDYADPWGRDNP